MYFGQNIKLIREKWGLSQTEFGLLVGASRGMIMQYELRNSKPKTNTVARVSKVTRFTSDVLFSNTINFDDIESMSLEDQVLIANYRDNPFEYEDLVREQQESEKNNRSKANKLFASIYEYLREIEYHPRTRDLVEMLELNSETELTEIFKNTRNIKLKPFKSFVARFSSLIPDAFLEDFLDLYPLTNSLSSKQLELPITINELNKDKDSSLVMSNSIQKLDDQKYTDAKSPFFVAYVSIANRETYLKSISDLTFVSNLPQQTLTPETSSEGAIWRYFEIDTDCMLPEIKKGNIGLFTQVHNEDWYFVSEFKTYLVCTDSKIHFGKPFYTHPHLFIMGTNVNNKEAAFLEFMSINEVWELRRIITKPQVLFDVQSIKDFKRLRDETIEELTGGNNPDMPLWKPIKPE